MRKIRKDLTNLEREIDSQTRVQYGISSKAIAYTITTAVGQDTRVTEWYDKRDHWHWTIPRIQTGSPV